MVRFSVSSKMECTSISTLMPFYISELDEVQYFRECVFKGDNGCLFNFHVPPRKKIVVGKTYDLVFSDVVTEDGKKHICVEILDEF